MPKVGTSSLAPAATPPATPAPTPAVTPPAPAPVAAPSEPTSEQIIEVYGDIRARSRFPGQRGVLAIDPGEKHIGVAVGLAFAFVDDDGKVVPDSEDELAHAFEMGYWSALFAIETAIQSGWVDILVIEDWKLYEDEMPALVGSKCETARFIGAIEMAVRRYNRQSVDLDTGHFIELYEQPAHLQDTTKAYLRKFGIDRTSKPGNPHALSAELHWWYLVLQQRGLLGEAKAFQVPTK